MQINLQTNGADALEQIEARLCALQTAHVALQENVKNERHRFERHLDEDALRIIQILDMLDNTSSSRLGLSNEVPSNAERIIKKIEKRLIEILTHNQVQEIIVKNGCVEAGKTRVIETRPASEEAPAGTIIQICRKGYQRGDKVIRPTDVITAGT
ncbi:MAG TPA: nucleotide exchange factor GrpE [Legionella sp.]|nr:nucleotide exchange factor GrpE [Legionella sp.]